MRSEHTRPVLTASIESQFLELQVQREFDLTLRGVGRNGRNDSTNWWPGFE